jgi:CubicO group peptidase (beta-lactamase class C family)
MNAREKDRLVTTSKIASVPVVEETIAHLIAEGRETGLQVVAYLDGKLVVDTWAGLADERSGRPVTADTLFNVYSLTKPVAATALHILADRGIVEYDAPVATYWPEFAQNGKSGVTVRHVLTHRAGIPQMPEGMTPERMCDFNWMTDQIAALTPLAPPGEKALYLSMTFGWIVAAIVNRADPKSRTIGQFVREEIALPLDAPDLWIGLPASELARVAHMTNASPAIPPEMLPPLYAASMPAAVDLVPEVFQRADVAQAEIAGVGGIFTARSCARFWAMLAQGGELDGVRLLSEDLVRTFNAPRENPAEEDTVMFGMPIPLGIAGFWLGADAPPVAAAKHARAICHPGAGNSFGFADPETKLAFAFCHNRMFQPQSISEDSARQVADAVRKHLGID